jgi:hypothetical protein
MKTRLTFYATIIVIIMTIISGCKKDEEEIKSNEIEYAENLIVIDSTELISITSINDQGSIVIPTSTALAGKLQTGMIIAGVSPYGFLKKITGVTNNGSNSTFTTENATLEDAFINISVDFSRQLSFSDAAGSNNFKKGVSVKSVNGEGFFVEANNVILWDGDENSATTEDQIKANGSFFMEPKVNFDFYVRQRRLEDLYFSLQNNQSTELTVFVGSEVMSREAEFSLAHITMNPICIQAGLVPIIVVPIFEVTLGAEVGVNLRVQTEASQSSTLEYGVKYQNGSWEPISHAEMSFSYQPPQLSASAEVKGYFGPQFNLLLYGIAGPYTDANAFMKLGADVFSTPWWTLYGGGEAGVGMHVGFLSHSLADFYLPNVLNYQQIIAQANGGAEGTIKGSVKDALSQHGLADVQVKVKKDNQYFGTSVSESDGQFSIAAPAGEGIIVEFAKAGYLPVVYHNVIVSVNEDTYLEPVLQIDDSHGGNGSISGYILNALDGSGVPGCSLNIRSGINATEGAVVATAVSSNNGSYSLQSLPAGQYTIQAQRQGFTECYFTVVCIGGQNQNNQNGTMTPTLNNDEIRIILTWGASPTDLDSHLTGPTLDGGRFHVYYYYKTFYQNGFVNAALDYDDVSSFGPETVTIYQLSPGVYRYSVHDFSNRNEEHSLALSNSSAQVRVYQESTLISSFNVPSNTEGTLWTVFEMSNGHITPVNALSNVTSSGAVTTPSGSNDLNLFMTLPAKK